MKLFNLFNWVQNLVEAFTFYGGGQVLVVAVVHKLLHPILLTYLNTLSPTMKS
jgi:hypothetical protein